VLRELGLDFMRIRRQMCCVEIASWLDSWLMHLWRAVAVPDIASAQAMEQQQRPDDGIVFLTVVCEYFVRHRVRRNLRVLVCPIYEVRFVLRDPVKLLYGSQRSGVLQFVVLST
jgi:hypothetical protein